MKKLLITLLFCLFFIPNVNATNGVVNGGFATSQISIPVSAQWYYRSGGEINTTFSPLTPGLCDFGECNYYSARTTSTDNLLSFNVGQTLETNFLYSLTVYVGSSNNVNLADVPKIVGFGNYNGGAKDSYLNGTCRAMVFNYNHSYNIKYNISQFYGVEDSSDLIESGAYYWIIKSNCGYPVVNVPVSFASDPTQIRFFGYHLEPLGYANNLSNSDIQNIVNNATSDLASSNDLQEVENNIKSQVEESTNKIDNTINNSDVNGVENSFDSFEGFISENSTITQLITMPITLYSSILNGIQSTCQPFVLGNLFGTNLTIPCVNIGNYLGTALWTMIDVIISGFAIFAISKKLIKIFNNFSSMKEGDVIDD